MSEEQVRIQDDLYEAVNGEWLKTAVIPEDRPTTGGFSDLDQDVEKTMMADFRAFAAGEKTSDIPEMKYAVALYKKVLDTDRRNREGIAPALPLLEKLRGIETVEALNAQAAELLVEGVDLPIQMEVTADMADATKNAFIVLGPNIILPDTTYYAEDNPAGKQLLAIWADMAAKALAFTPLTAEEQKRYLDDALAFDALVAQKVKSRLEWSEYYKCHNPMDVDEVAAQVAPFDIKKLLTDLYGENAPKTLVVYDPKAIREMNGYFSAENFELYRHWTYVNALLRSTAYLSEELAALGKTYRRALMGVASDPSLEKQAYQTASRMYSEPVGVYYGRTYFGFTTFGHTMENVFYAMYHPQNDVENGFITNEQMHKYLCRQLNLTDSLPKMTSDIYADHHTVFAGYATRIDSLAPNQFVLVVKNKKKTLEIPSYTNYFTINKKQQVELSSVIVYMPENKTFYLPKNLARYLEEK